MNIQKVGTLKQNDCKFVLYAKSKAIFSKSNFAKISVSK